MPSILPNLCGSTSRISLTFAQRLVIVLLVMGVMGVEVMGMPILTPSPNPFPEIREGERAISPRQEFSSPVYGGGGSQKLTEGVKIDPLAPGESRVVMLDGEAPALLTFVAESGDVVTIIARTLEPDTGEREARNVVVDVLDANGQRLAYNDNHFGLDDDLLPTDAAIEKLILPESGTYTIRVNTYGGIFPGEVEVTLLEADLFEATITESDDLLTITAVLPENQPYRTTFEVAAGDVLQITARDTSGTLDPMLRLVEADGALLAFNDDHGTASTELDVFDAMLSEATIDEDGPYTLIVSDFLGRAGAFELMVVWRK